MSSLELRPVIMLDIDGVMVTTPAWRAVELEADGFLKFNEKAVKNLVRILASTGAEIVLTTTHRISYTLAEWRKILENRGIRPPHISKVNELTALHEMGRRASEVEDWVTEHGNRNYVVIDDDLSINGLPAPLKERCVLTKPMLGLDEEASNKALAILSASGK